MSGGIGGGFERGAQSFSQSVLAGIQLGQRQSYVDAYAKRAALSNAGSADAWHPLSLRRPYMMGALTLGGGTGSGGTGSGTMVPNKVP